MPAATTHAEFAKSVYESLPEEISRTITSMPMYFLGSQGPDLLLFSRYMVLPGSLNKYGAMMHNQKVRETIAYFRRHALTPSLYSYFMGYLTHYALDSICHPIINSYAKREAEQNGTDELEAHFRIEGELDAWVLNQSGRSVKDYCIYNMLRISEAEANDLGRLYHGLFETVYAMNIPAKRFEEACYDCMRITRQLRPGKWKHRAVRVLESAVRMPHLVTGMMLTDKDHAQPSILNPDKEIWVWYGDSHKGFAELRDEAAELARQLILDPREELIRKTFNGVPLGETILWQTTL